MMERVSGHKSFLLRFFAIPVTFAIAVSGGAALCTMTQDDAQAATAEQATQVVDSDGNGVVVGSLADGEAAAASPSAQLATESKKTYAKHIVSGKSSATVKKYDITGDGKRDKIRFKTVGSVYSGRTYVYINGKRKLSLKAGTSISAWLMRVKSGRTFLYVGTEGGDDPGDMLSEGVWTYRKGKLVKASSLKIWPRYYKSTGALYHSNCYLNHVQVRSFTVSGNTVRVKYFAVNTITGMMKASFSFKASGKKLKLASKYTSRVRALYPVNGKNKSTRWLTTCTSFNVYKKSSGKGKVSTIYAGTRVKVLAVKLRPSNHFIAVKVRTKGGTRGWITYKTMMGLSYSSLHGGTLFQETYTAG